MPAIDFEPPIAHSPESARRKIAAACIVAAGFIFLTIVAAGSFDNETASRRDFIEYWAAATQVSQHRNPYDVQAILALEQKAGMAGATPHVSLSPPVALAFAVPLGHVSPAAGFVAWIMVGLACLGLGSLLLWRLFGSPDNRLHLLLFLFAPVLACEYYGQLGVFLLFSLTLFLALHRGHPVLAGAALYPFALKPHLVLPLALILVLWSLRERTGRIIAGYVAMLAIGCVLSLYYDPHAWAHYARMMSVNEAFGTGYIPTLSVLIRNRFFPSMKWVSYVPEMCACGWAAWFYWRRRDGWSWVEDGLLVLLVAQVCTPYAWLMDESILFPAVLLGMYRATQAKRSLLPIFAAGALAIIELFGGLTTNSWYFLWTTPTWLAWFLYATSSTLRKDSGLG